MDLSWIDLVHAVFVFGVMGVILYLYISRRRNRWHTISEYQRGMFYRDGKLLGEVAPGTYKLRIGRDFLIFVDLRPEAFDLDQTAVSTLDGGTAFYSIAGKIEVQDVRKAIYCARNYYQAALVKTISTVRRMLNDYQSSDIKNHTQTVCDTITQAVQAAVAELGMKIFDLRLNHLRIVDPVSGKTERSDTASA
jgi:hypothetical protein